MPPDERDLALKVLSDKQVAVVELYERGYSQRAIAAALGISRASVRDRLDHAQNRLAAAVRERAV